MPRTTVRMGCVNRGGAWRGRLTGAGLPAATASLAAAGAVLGLGALVETLARHASSDVTGHYTLFLCLLALATTVPVALPRPPAAAITVSAAGVLSVAPFHSLTFAGAAALLVVLYRLSGGGAQVLAGGLAAPFLVLALAAPGHGENRILAVLLAALAPTAAWAGAARRARSDAQAHSAAREAIDGSLLEYAARGERARIARELHDVVAHHISMIAVQAETARLTTAGLPAAGAKRFSAIGDTARTALTEMRRLLGVLREDVQAETPELAPQPGLRQLNELLDETRDAAHTSARLILRGAPDALDPGVELAAYRIVQEALTNARRHAPGAAVDVELRYCHDSLQVRIRDNGPGPASVAPAAGHGLLGMRERAAAVGGTLRTGPALGGGFIVEATLPAKTELAR
jgi:signal transduction histidine kinase